MLESSLEFTPEGNLQVATPLYAQVMLESRAGLRKYFRIEEINPPLPDGAPVPTEQGKTLLGMPEMPRPPEWPRSNGLPIFYDSVYRNDPVRVVAVVRDLYYQGMHRQVLVMVAESTGKRIEAESNAQRQEILRDARMLALVALLVWWGVSWALKPLRRLRADIRGRRPDDLTPLDAARVPSEVAPLVDAVNHHIARYRRVLDEQSQFLADASHQLRTPLAIMLTQAQYALRERDPARAQEGLRAIVGQLGRTRRLTEQLLSLAHANQAESLPRQLLDMNDVSREVVLKYLPLAHESSRIWAGAAPKPRTAWIRRCLCPAARPSCTRPCPTWFTTRSTTRLPARASRSRSAGLTDASKSQCPTMGRGWIRSCARAPSRVSSVSARTGRRPHRRVRAWAWRSRGPMRAATTATSSCAMENPMAREASAWHRCCGCRWRRRCRRTPAP